MQQTCNRCSAKFTLSDDELALLKKASPSYDGTSIEIPLPQICSDCSAQQRFSFRNEFAYYKRKCDKTGENIISLYSPKSPYKVYKRDVWFSDAYDPLAYGRDVDFSRPFFDQLQELSVVVPYAHMVIINSENCDYCHMIVDSKNCYLSVRILAEDVAYCYVTMGPSRDCIDCHTVYKSELCYECIDCTDAFNCKWCQRCKQCSDCMFCVDCTGCKNCFGCSGLIHKEYHIWNEAYSKEDYERKMKELNTGSESVVRQARVTLDELEKKRPQRFAYIEQSENCSGDYIVKSRNVQRSFDVEDCEDAWESLGIEHSKDIGRSSHLFHAEVSYEHLSCTHSQNVRFCYGVYDSHSVDYCMMVYSGTHDCFGCIGMKQNSYCILNKQYTKEEYEKLVPKIIAHMKKHGEYGQFFPVNMSHFAYNETYAQQAYPLSKEKALKAGFTWSDQVGELAVADRVIPASELPDNIHDIPDDVLNWAIVCEKTGKPFRLIKKELTFYRQHSIPVPRLHPSERHLLRAERRRPQRLWNRECAKCQKPIQTTYAPDRPETVYCEECYLAGVY